MLCPFKRVTTRLPSGQTNGQALGLCSADNCMAYYEKDEYDTKPPFSKIGKRPACRLIELPFAAQMAYCSAFDPDDEVANPEELDDE